ncbi:MAG: hypothetical protein J5736_00920, partial [Bacilli bacterium]|nr:hypothetical protein [Bacilli bacterium]
THFPGRERIAFEMTLGSKHEGLHGNLESWLTGLGAMDFGNPKQVAMTYDDTNKAYDVTLSFALGDDYAVGADINFSISYQDGKTADAEWGAGESSAFSHAFKLVSKDAPVTPVDPDPEQPPVDPQPVEGVVPGPENPNYQIVAQDLAGLPSASDWANATPYAMIPIWGDTTGASASIKVFTANNNLFWRIEATDPAINIQQDGLYIKIETVGEEPTTIMEGRGNYDNWIAWITQTCGSPSLLEISTDLTDNKAYQSGHLTMDQGFYMPDICVPEGKVHMVLKYRDSRNSGEGWMDADYLHTLVFDQVITFGAKADTTVRPVEPTQGFSGSTKDISFDKATVCWNEVSGADSYKIYEYLVNPQGSEEPYEHIAIDGPIYAGEDSYEEEILGLSESTAYAAQVIAYDEDGNVIGASALVLFSTISREEAMQGGSSSEPTSSEPTSELTSEPTSQPTSEPTSVPTSEPATPSTSAPASSEPAPSQPEKKGGCGSAVTFSILALSGVMFAGLAIVTKKSKKD